MKSSVVLLCFLFSCNNVERLVNPATSISSVLNNPGKYDKPWIEGEVEQIISVPLLASRFSIKDTTGTIWVATKRNVMPRKGLVLKIQVVPREVFNVSDVKYVECDEVMEK